MIPTTPTCSGVFFRLHCRHTQLFEKEYKRSFDVQPRIPLGANSLFVFARFETLDLDSTLSLGQQCSLRYLQSVSQSETNPEAAWVQGVMQNPSRAQAASAMPSTRVFLLNGQTSSKWYYHWESGANKARRLTKHALKAYILYRRPLPAGTAPSAASARDDAVQVIGIVSSPPFTLVSYRRAAWEGMDPMESGSPYTAMSSIVSTETPTDVALQRIARSQSHATASLSVGSHLSKPAEVTRCDLDDTAGSNNATDERDKFSMLNCTCCEAYASERPAVSAVLKDQWVWERQHSGMMAHVKDLAIILYFVSTTSMETLLQPFRLREHVFAALRLHWCGLFGSQSPLASPEIVLTSLFPGWFAAVAAPTSMGSSGSSFGGGGIHSGRPVDGSVSRGASARSERLLLSVSKLCVWAMGDENVAIMREFFAVHSVVLLDKPRLRDAFLHWIALIYKRIQIFCMQEFVGESNTTETDSASPCAPQSRDLAVRTVRAISEHIIALIHESSGSRSDPTSVSGFESKLHAKWSVVRDILEQPGVLLWESFVAQLREVYTCQQRAQASAWAWQQDIPRCPPRSFFGGRWSLDAGSVVVDPAPVGRFPGASIGSSLSMLSCLMAMHQLLRVELNMLETGILRLLQIQLSRLHPTAKTAKFKYKCKFNSTAQQLKKPSSTAEALISSIQNAFESMAWAKLDRVFMTLQSVMNEVMRKYHGRPDESVDEFIFEAKLFMSGKNIDYNRHENQARVVAMVASNLRSGAASWYHSRVMVDRMPITNIDEFEQALTAEFIPPDQQQRLRAALRACRQTGHVDDYVARFRKIIAQVREMSQLDKVDRFVEGLKPETKKEVNYLRCTTLTEAIAAAQAYERDHFGGERPPRRPRSNGDSGPEPMDLSNAGVVKPTKDMCRQQNLCPNVFVILSDDGDRGIAVLWERIVEPALEV
ncbi:hypothetical protein ATCC90586_001664 [Pythium insidiosum]|nr:hypothetical protein ATCC90586_001664 [Pythium insidiosum]